MQSFFQMNSNKIVQKAFSLHIYNGFFGNSEKKPAKTSNFLSQAHTMIWLFGN
jgi:hypothetical protein